MALSQTCLASSLQTADNGRRKRDLHASGGDDGRIHAQGLAAYRVEVRQVHQAVVVEVSSASCGRCVQFASQLVLHRWILSEEMEDAG